VSSPAFEKHFRVKELAELWRVSAKTIRGMFAGEAGVIRISNHGTSNQKYVVLSIPESVASRVHDGLSDQPFEATPAGGHPLRVIRLRDLDARVPKQPRSLSEK
jgi:hypothetical protein